MSDDIPNGVGDTEGLYVHWNNPLSEVVKLDLPPLSAEASERHHIFSLLTMALVSAYWNGNKYGAEGSYPWRPTKLRKDGRYEGGRGGDRYIGHNIACIAVDENGLILDFDFNHNDIFNSSAEHAESRLIRRLFSLNQNYNYWQISDASKFTDVSYGNLLNGVTIYTSLESCAQCSGIMALGAVQRVVYLQSDPGQYLVGNLLYNLSRPYPKAALLKKEEEPVRPAPTKKTWAPEPVSADGFKFSYKARLDAAFLDFLKKGKDTKTWYFWTGAKGTKLADSLTSFLCTDEAEKIFADAADELKIFEPAHGCHKPKRSDGMVDPVMTNTAVLAQARQFLAHAVEEARRGTPHR